MDEGRTVCPIIFTSPSSLKWHVAGYQDVPEQQHPASLVHQTQSRGDSIVGVRDSARVMATKMPTVEARVLGHPDWGVELSRHQYDVEGIELKNEKMMTAIFQDLGIPEDDFRRQSQLRAYIKKHQANDGPHQKKAKTKRNETCIQAETLSRPVDVFPPKTSEPPFVCESNWMEEVEIAIERYLMDADDQLASADPNNDAFERVPPMAVVRCSRGGKTRFLYEIANEMRGYNKSIGSNVACIYVSFNDYSSLEPWEHDDPLQALLRRIAFEARRKESDDPTKGRTQLFSDFVNTEPTWSEESFLEWIGSTPCLLLVDELNNLRLLKETGDCKAARDFCRFVKKNFIGMKNRYFLFSSHVVSALPFFAMYLDASHGSSRSVELQELPLVPSLKAALVLNPNISSTREAVYYGRMPAMIFESRPTRKDRNGKLVSRSKKSIAGKREWAVKSFIERTTDYDDALKRILESLVTGFSSTIPEELHILLDSAPDRDGLMYKVRWVLVHLQYVLGELGRVSFANCQLAESLSGYCDLLNPKEESGEGWENLFVLFLVARCLIGKPHDDFVPVDWFQLKKFPKVNLNTCYNSELNDNKLFSACKTWNELRKGIVHSKEPALSIFYPTHSSFEVYDVIVVYSHNCKGQSVYGYQLKEGKAQRGHSAADGVDRSFFIQGAPPQKTVPRDDKGWTVPNQIMIDSYFGESGHLWTPRRWKEFRECIT